MAYDEELADRVRNAMPADTSERRMFGGLGFMHDDHLTVALGRNDLMVRVGVDAVPEALQAPGAGPCVMGQRTMADWVLVDATALTDTASVSAWVARALAFVPTLPAKS